MNSLNTYWYSRGYYDGRANGNESCPDGLDDGCRLAYRQGYDAGVMDYCELDEKDAE